MAPPLEFHNAVAGVVEMNGAPIHFQLVLAEQLGKLAQPDGERPVTARRRAGARAVV